MATVRRTPQAEADLEAILGDLDGKNSAVAERFAVHFAERAKLLTKFPEIGPDLRSILVYPYMIFIASPLMMYKS